MNLYYCSRQQEVAAALRKRQWPEACTPELRMHVESCHHCKELLLVAQTLQQARQEAMPMARLVPPGLLWWRAQLRRQNAIAERIAKPIGLVEKFALAITLLWAARLAFGQLNEMADWLRWLADLPYYNAFRLDALWPAVDGTSFWALPVASAATLCMLGGLAAYLVARSE